ncbi:hypothetical protein D3C71_1710060 [compost metagenome]
MRQHRSFCRRHAASNGKQTYQQRLRGTIDVNQPIEGHDLHVDGLPLVLGLYRGETRKRFCTGSHGLQHQMDGRIAQRTGNHHLARRRHQASLAAHGLGHARDQNA